MTAAGMMFAAEAAWRVLEGEVAEALLRASGVEPADGDSWPMVGITYDGYDNSFEFKGVKGDWTPSAEQLSAYWVLGFSRCWVCYDNLDGEGVCGEAGEEVQWREKYFRNPAAEEAELAAEEAEERVDVPGSGEELVRDL